MKSADFRVYAHRGVSSMAPENTMGAFVKCLDYGIDWFEFDVTMASDGSLMVIHDDMLNRTTSGRGKVVEKTFAELRVLDAGVWFAESFRFERIPELATVIDFMNNTGLGANLELKAYPAGNDSRENFVKAALVALQKLRDGNKILVSSFDHDLLAAFAKECPQVKTGYLLEAAEVCDPAEPWRERAAEIGCSAIHPGLDGLTADDVQRFRAAGYEVNVWTVNDRQTAEQLREWGVNGVFSDRPQDLL